MMFFLYSLPYYVYVQTGNCMAFLEDENFYINIPKKLH